MIFINCPKCGQKLMEAESGSCVQTKCSKCSNIIKVEIKDTDVKLSLIQKH